MHLIKRPDSANYWFKLRTPSNVIGQLKGKQVLLHLSHGTDSPLTKVATVGEFITFSVETDDDHMAGVRERNATGHIEKLFKVTAAVPAPISHHDLVALSKTAYDLYIEVYYQEPGSHARWTAHKALSRAALEGRIANPPPAIPGHNVADERLAAELFGSDLTAGINAMTEGKHSHALEKRFGIVTDWVLTHFELALSAQDRERFLKQVALASIQSNWTLKRAADGDYSPDPNAARFPSMDKVKAIRPRQTITGLFKDWWSEAEKLGRTKSTHDGYKNATDRLSEFLKHDDANRVTVDDAIRFKDHRLKTVSPKTFRDGDLPGLKSVFAWGLANHKVRDNPFANVTIKREKKIVVRSPGFTDDEATAIFRHCLGYERKPKEDPKTAAAKKWGPLIAAYTGCRIAEALQLRKADIYKEGGHHALRFTPEAGSIKSGVFRVVPIHQHLIDFGFLKFVKDSEDGPLFAKGSYERVVKFVREVVTDKNVQPNHGWRHRLKTVGRNLGLDARVMDAIQGHAPTTAGEAYGDVTLVAMSRALAKVPRIKV
jgi:integrase